MRPTMADLDDVAGSVEAKAHPEVRDEIADLLAFMRQARAEIAAIRPGDIPAATDELDAVIKSTEQATFTILDAAETLTTLAGSVDPAAAATLNQLVTRIYEASNFQDISGQRINKVIKMLRHIEQRLVALAGTLGIEGEIDAPKGAADGDRALLSGPQLPESAAKQDDIDSLFDSL